MRMQEGKECASKTRYQLYEYLVMPFGLANSPSSFYHFINDILQGYLDIFATAYINNILVYSNSLSEHKKHVKLILDWIRHAELQLNIAKSKFHVQEVTFLRLFVGKNGIQMDPKKIEAVQDWAVLQSVKDIQSFIGLANFYQRFIKDFSKVTRSIIDLIRKNKHFLWSAKCSSVCQCNLSSL